MFTNAHRRALAPLLLLFALAGCSGVLESRKPARQVYLLRPPAAAPAGATEAAATLVLAVTAVPGLDTDRILVLGPDARLQQVANAHWADHLPEVFTSVTRRALAESGRFNRVAIGAIARPGEWFAEVELQAFYGVQGAAGTTERVQLRLEIALRCGRHQQRLTVERDRPAGTDGIAGLVAAHQRVLDEALTELPQLIVSTCTAP